MIPARILHNPGPLCGSVSYYSHLPSTFPLVNLMVVPTATSLPVEPDVEGRRGIAYNAPPPLPPGGGCVGARRSRAAPERNMGGKEACGPCIHAATQAQGKTMRKGHGETILSCALQKPDTGRNCPGSRFSGRMLQQLVYIVFMYYVFMYYVQKLLQPRHNELRIGICQVTPLICNNGIQRLAALSRRMQYLP